MDITIVMYHVKVERRCLYVRKNFWKRLAEGVYNLIGWLFGWRN